MIKILNLLNHIFMFEIMVMDCLFEPKKKSFFGQARKIRMKRDFMGRSCLLIGSFGLEKFNSLDIWEPLKEGSLFVSKN